MDLLDVERFQAFGTVSSEPVGLPQPRVFQVGLDLGGEQIPARVPTFPDVGSLSGRDRVAVEAQNGQQTPADQGIRCGRGGT